MKIFLIQPMNGRSEEEITQERKIVENFFKMIDCEIINSLYKDKPPESNNEGLFYLGKSVQAMSEADLVVALPNWKKNKGCKIEYECAHKYGLEIAEMTINFHKNEEADE